MVLDDVSTPEVAVERIKKVMVKLQQDIARFDLPQASISLKSLEELCSFIYAYKEAARHKTRLGMQLSQFDSEILPTMDVYECLSQYIPMLKSRIDKIYSDENIHGYPIPHIKNVKQEDCLDVYWAIVEKLNIGAPEQPMQIEQQTVFARLGR